MTSVTAVQCSTTCILPIYGYITNSQRGQLPGGLIDQLVVHCNGIAVPGHGFEYRSGMKFLQALISYFVKLCIMINHVFISFSAIQIHGLVFVTIYGYITNGLFMTSKENRRTDLKQNEHRNLTSNRRLDTFCN